MAMVQQFRIWQCLYHYLEDQGANLLLCSHHLLYLVFGELDAGYALGSQG